MSRASGKGIGPVLVLGAVGVVAGIGLFMTTLAHEGERTYACSQVVEFMQPRVNLVDRHARETLDGLTDPQAWRDAAGKLGEVYAGLGADLRNRRLLPVSDPPAAADASRMGESSQLIATRLRSLDGTLRTSEALGAATAQLRDNLVAAEARCR